MSITIFGYFAIPLGIAFMLYKSEVLLLMTIFFSGFTGTAVLLFGVDLGIQPSYYFAILWLITEVVKRPRLSVRVLMEQKILLVFLLLATTSIVMPVILRDEITVMNTDGEIVNLRFTSANITQLLYLYFCIIFYVRFYEFQTGRKAIEIDRLLSIYLGGGDSCLRDYDISNYSFCIQPTFRYSISAKHSRKHSRNKDIWPLLRSKYAIPLFDIDISAGC